MRKLLLFLLVLVVLGVAADFVAARVAEDRVADVLRREYGLDRRPVVQVRDFPFLPHLVSGRFDTVDVAARDVRAEGVRARQVELHLHDVVVDRGVALGRPGPVTVGRADGRVELGQDEVNQLFANRLQGGTLVLQDGGVRLRVSTTLLGQPVDAVVAGRLGARAGQVTLTPERVRIQGLADTGLERQLASAFDLAVPLPQLPAGVRVERVVTQPGALILFGRARTIGVVA